VTPLTIDIARLKREYRAVCNKCCINPDEGPASSFEVALARGELAKLRQGQARHTYADWERLRDVSAYWIDVVSHLSPGGWNWFEAAVWARVIADVRHRHPRTVDDVTDCYDRVAIEAAFVGIVQEVLREERSARVDRGEIPLREAHRRQAAKGYAPMPLRFRQVAQ
jgi:hypothetical protein